MHKFAVNKKHRTWELVDPPAEKDIVGLKWIFKTKQLVRFGTLVF